MRSEVSFSRFYPWTVLTSDPELRKVNVDVVTFGQYMRPTKRHMKVDRYVEPAEFDRWKQVAEDMGVGDTFHPTPAGVFFGGPDAQGGERVEDPFFGGAGPARNACLNCGECMTGCRHNAKNTLVKNTKFCCRPSLQEPRILMNFLSSKIFMAP